MGHTKTYHRRAPEVTMACVLLLWALKRSPHLEQETGSSSIVIHNSGAWTQGSLPILCNVSFSILSSGLVKMVGIHKNPNQPTNCVCIPSKVTKFIKITSVHLPEIFVVQVVGGWEKTRRSMTCICFAHSLFFSGLLTLLEVGYGAGQALHFTCYSCSHVWKLWDFKHLKNPERNGLLPKYHVGFVFIFKKPIKSKMFRRSSRNFTRKQFLECIRFKGLLVVWLFSVPMFEVLYITICFNTFQVLSSRNLCCSRLDRRLDILWGVNSMYVYKVSLSFLIFHRNTHSAINTGSCLGGLESVFQP